MSDATMLVMVTGMNLLGLFCFSYTSWKANHVGHLIATGQANGKQFPRGYRSVLVYQHWLSWVLTSIGIAVLVGIANVQLARVEPVVKPVAYFVAFGAGVCLFSWTAHGVREFQVLRSIIRDAETTKESQ